MSSLLNFYRAAAGAVADAGPVFTAIVTRSERVTGFPAGDEWRVFGNASQVNVLVGGNVFDLFTAGSSYAVSIDGTVTDLGRLIDRPSVIRALTILRFPPNSAFPGEVTSGTVLQVGTLA